MDIMLKGILSDEQRTKLDGGKDVDLAINYENSRLRVNVFKDTKGYGFVLRLLSPKMPELSALSLPPKLKDIITNKQGLFLVTGATGSGKSTSLAAMLNEINKTRQGHIITIEDPVEYEHGDNQSIFTQRELGDSTPSFPEALRSALRQAPNIIMVGELRDRETAKAALAAAETGHLVFATLHTGSAPLAIDRLVNMFSAEDHPSVRASLADNLLGVMTQQLVNKADGKGRVAAAELLVVNSAVKNNIRKGETNGIRQAFQIGKKDGMVTMEQSLNALKTNGAISHEEHARAIEQYNRDSGITGGLAVS